MQVGKKQNNRGQGLLEFALVLPFLVVVVFGVFDLGRIYFTSIMLTSAAREGARYLSVYPDDVTNAYVETKQVTYEEARNSGIELDMDSGITAYCDLNDDLDSCASGSTALITVRSDFEMILGWMLSSPVTITRSAQMVVP